MEQVSIEKYLTPSSPSRFAYSFSIHLNDAEAYDVVCRYIEERFDIWHVAAPEVSPNGNYHIQGYGETSREFVKNDRKVFQPKGRYYKYINSQIKKPFGCTVARRSRYYNVMYCLKQVYGLSFLCTEKDSDVLARMVEASREYQGDVKPTRLRKEASTSYESKMVRWYLDKPIPDRPQSVSALTQMILDEGMYVWNRYDPRDLLKISRFLLSKCGQPAARAGINARMLAYVEELDARGY